VEWSEPCWPVWGSLDGEVGSIFGCDRIFYGIWGLVLRSGVGDSNSMLSHDPVPLDTPYPSTYVPVVDRSVLQCC